MPVELPLGEPLWGGLPQGGVELPFEPLPGHMPGGVLLGLPIWPPWVIWPQTGGRGQIIFPLSVFMQNMDGRVDVPLPCGGTDGGVELPFCPCPPFKHGLTIEKLPVDVEPLPFGVLIAKLATAAWFPLLSVTQKVIW